jgi:lysozyme
MIIDVSIHNGSINWAKVKAAGVTGAIIRCGYGRDFKRQDDARFKENIEGAIAQGLRVGVYIYSYAKTIESAKSEAAHVLRLIEPYKNNITLPIYYDLEEKGTESGAKERAIVFGDIVEKAGYWVGIYASLSWFTTYLKGLDRFTKWIAAWGANTGKPGTKPAISCDLWQYTSNARVNGINGRVDASELLNDKIGGYIGSASASKPTTPPTTNKPTAEKPSAPTAPATTEPSYISYKIKRGDTLSAIAKKYKTTCAAIKAANPDKIKNINKIYAGDVIKIPKV